MATDTTLLEISQRFYPQLQITGYSSSPAHLLISGVITIGRFVTERDHFATGFCAVPTVDSCTRSNLSIRCEWPASTLRRATVILQDEGFHILARFDPDFTASVDTRDIEIASTTRVRLAFVSDKAGDCVLPISVTVAQFQSARGDAGDSDGSVTETKQSPGLIAAHHPIFERFKPFSGVCPAGFTVDAAGVLVDHKMLDPSSSLGFLEDTTVTTGPPSFGGEGYFDLIGIACAVDAATDRFVMIELGAGYGYWISQGAKLALSRGLDVQIVGVEAEPQHYAMMRRHLDYNEISHLAKTIEAAVAPQDGHVFFEIGDSNAWWGQAIRDDMQEEQQIDEGRRTKRTPAVSLSTLLSDFTRVDALHMDIQGAELTVLASAWDQVCRKCFVVVIGTHSKEIEIGLRELFQGWRNIYDFELSKTHNTEFGTIELGDGIQVWMNSDFKSTYQPHLDVIDRSAAAEIRQRQDLDWFHRIEVDGYVTPGHEYEENWQFVSSFLRRHEVLIREAEVLEPGCADGLWTCWFTKLGAKHIDATDVATREQFRLIARAFGLPARYYPGILSTALPNTIKRSYDLVASLGLLYHVHDPFTTLCMYVRYLRDGGSLFLETGSIDTTEPYLHYTGRGEIYGKQGGNQFIPTTGFLMAALEELGMTVKDVSFRSEATQDLLGKPVGRVVVMAQKTGSVGVHYYGSLIAQLAMDGPEFTRQRCYEWIV